MNRVQKLQKLSDNYSQRNNSIIITNGCVVTPTNP